MEDKVKQAVMMIAENIFFALIDKQENTVSEWVGQPQSFAHPVYAWVDSRGDKTMRVLLTTARETAMDVARSMYMLNSTDQVDDDSLRDAIGEIANVVGGNLKAVVDDAGELTIPQVSRCKPWEDESPLVVLNLNWKDKMLVVSINDMANMPMSADNGGLD